MLTEEQISKCQFINIGCGTQRFNNCVNMDIAQNSKVDADVIGTVLSIPFPNCRFKGVILSHVLEHLEMRNHKQALFEIRRVLVESGNVFIEVPDFETSCRKFLENSQGRKDWWYMTIFGRGAYEGDEHRSGITRQYLTDLLFDCGFGRLKWPSDNEDFITVIATKLSIPEGRIK